MDTVKKLIITIILFICSISAHAQTVAGTEIANIQSWLMNTTDNQLMVKPNPQTDTYSRNYVTQDNRYLNVLSKADYRASNGRIYPITIEKTGEIDGSKVGKAVVRMAKILPPVALGVEVYNLVCELSHICKKDGSDEWEIPGESIPSQNSIWDCSGFGNMTVTECLENIQGCNQGSVICDNPRLSSDAKSYLWDKKFTNGTFIGVITMTRVNPYELSQPRIPTESDWEASETQLNDERFDEPLLANGQPVPLKNLPIFGNNPPVQLSDSETVIRDSQGNITGTRRTITQLELSDGATSSQPGRVTGIETQTQTDYNTSGQPTGTQTSTNTPPPLEKPQEPPTISFDNAEGLPIETEVVPMQLPAANSWGEGVCPPDVALPFYGLSIPYQPACDAATMLRPVVILLASISALFIIAGLRESKA